MSELGVLGGGPSPYNLGVVATALRNGYPISEEKRAKCIDQAYAILCNPKSQKTCLAAIKVIIAADMVNVRREGLQVQERHNDILESASTIRTVLQVPGVCEQLADLADKTCSGQTQQVQGNSGEATEGPIVNKGGLPNGFKEMNGKPHKNGDGKPHKNGDGKHG